MYTTHKIQLNNLIKKIKKVMNLMSNIYSYILNFSEKISNQIIFLLQFF